MAEESGGASWWGSWGAEFLSNVRDKSAEAMNMVKQDLSEFVSTIQHDTSAVVADTATAVKESLKVEEEEPEGTSTRLKQGVSKFLGTLSNSLRENISHVATAAAAVTSDGPEPVFDRMQARLHEIQTDPATFCCEPDGHLAMYEEWCKTFDPDQHKGEISELLVNVPEIRALYAKLVPSAVSHVLFWQRYFYKVHQLEQEEKKRAALVARANQAEDEELEWGDDDFWDTEEAGVDSIISSKRGTSEEDKGLVPDGGNLAEAGNKEMVKEAPDEDKTEEADVDRQSAAHVESQEKTATTTELIKDQGESEKTSDRERLEVKGKEDSLQESDELLAKRTEQTPQSQLTNPEMSSIQHKESSPSETLQIPTTDASSDEKSSDQLPTSTHKRDNSSGSVDSSWSKLSEANSDKEAGLKEVSTGSGHSSSSSSGVLVPSVDDKDVDWDDDLDLNDDDDISEEEVKRIMQSMAANKQTKDNQDDEDGDDDDWENWD